MRLIGSAAPLLIAAAMHVAIAVTFAVVVRPAPRSAPVFEETAAGVEIDLAYAETMPAVAADAPAPAAARVVEPGAAAIAAIARATGETVREPGASSAPELAGAQETPAPAGEGWTFRPTTGPLDLRLSASAMAAVSPGEGPPQRSASPSSPRPVSTTGGLAESLDAADVARGLGRAGPVRTAVDEAARRPEAPTFGSAVFQVVLGSDGSVNVALAGASADRKAWDDLRPAIRAALANAKVRVPPPGKGVRVTIRVEASEQYPGGGRPVPDKKQGAAVHGSIGTITETKDHVEITPPVVALTYQTRKCSAGIAVTPGGVSLGGGCEQGAAMRVVETKIVSEERL